MKSMKIRLSGSACWFQGQPDGEDRSLTRRGANLYLAAVRLGYPLSNREAQAISTCRAIAC